MKSHYSLHSSLKILITTLQRKRQFNKSLTLFCSLTSIGSSQPTNPCDSFLRCSETQIKILKNSNHNTVHKLKYWQMEGGKKKRRGGARRNLKNSNHSLHQATPEKSATVRPQKEFHRWWERWCSQYLSLSLSLLTAYCMASVSESTNLIQLSWAKVITHICMNRRLWDRRRM